MNITVIIISFTHRASI